MAHEPDRQPQDESPDTDLAERLRRRAVALRYDRQKDGAPRVIGKGRGYIAEKIIALAEAEGITVYEDPDLVQMLAALNVHQEIPPKLYQVVAEVLAFVYRMNKLPLQRILGDGRAP